MAKPMKAMAHYDKMMKCIIIFLAVLFLFSSGVAGYYQAKYNEAKQLLNATCESDNKLTDLTNLLIDKVNMCYGTSLNHLSNLNCDFK